VLITTGSANVGTEGNQEPFQVLVFPEDAIKEAQESPLAPKEK
jgi:hypothetical protein